MTFLFWAEPFWAGEPFLGVFSTFPGDTSTSSGVFLTFLPAKTDFLTFLSLPTLFLATSFEGTFLAFFVGTSETLLEFLFVPALLFRLRGISFFLRWTNLSEVSSEGISNLAGDVFGGFFCENNKNKKKKIFDCFILICSFFFVKD